jgi:hypothetical protein
MFRSNSPAGQRVGTPWVTFAVRSERAGTASLMEEIRQAVRSVSGSIPIGQERTMQDLYAGSLARTSFTLVMLAIAGSMALALGAHPKHLQRMFVLHGLALSRVARRRSIRWRR